MGRQAFSVTVAWGLTCVITIGICEAIFEEPLLGLVIGTLVSIGHIACPLVPTIIYDGLEKILGPE